MICKNCKKEISDDSIFCGYCGHKVEKETENLEEIKKKRIPDKIYNLVFKIFGIVIASLGIITCFILVTSGFSDYRTDANIITYLPLNLKFALDASNNMLVAGHLTSLIIAYVLLIACLVICFLSLIYSIIELITNKEYKFVKVLHLVNFSFAIILYSLFETKGLFASLLLFSYCVYYLVKMILRLINSEEKTSLKIVYGIGIGFFGIFLANITSVRVYSLDYFVEIANNNKQYVNKLFLGMNIATFIIYVLAISFTIVSIIFLTKNKKFLGSIFMLITTFFVLLSSVFMNLGSTEQTLVSTFISPTVISLVSATFIFSIGIVEKKN